MGASMLSQMYVELAAVTDPFMEGFEAATEVAETFAELMEGLQEQFATITETFESAAGAGDQVAESLTVAGDGATELAGSLSALSGEASTGSTSLGALATALTELGAAGTEAGDGSTEAATGVSAVSGEATVGAGEVGALTVSLAGLSDSLVGVQAKADTTAASLTAVGDSAVKSSAKTKEAASGGLLDLGGALDKVHGFAGLAAVAVTVASVKMAADFETNMTKLVTSAGESESAIGLVSNGVLKLSMSTATSTTQLAAGMYQISSAGYTYAKGGLTVLSAAAEGAKAEGANLTDVGNALTTVLTNYKLPASAAVSVTNQMLTAVGQGKMTMQDFASSLSSVLPAAAALKIPFAQVAGSMADLTSKGESAQNAAFMVNNAIKSLGQPNAVAQAAMGNLGLSVSGLQATLADPNKGLVASLGQVYTAIMQHMGPSGQVLLNTFNTSQQASSDLNVMLGKMPTNLQTLANAMTSGSMSAGDYTKALKALPASQQAMGASYEALYTKSQGFNSSLKAGGTASTNFVGALSKVMGTSDSAQAALMLTSGGMSTLTGNVDAVAKSANGAGANIQGWSDITATFNFKLSQWKDGIEAAGIKIGTALIPKLETVMDVVQNDVLPIFVKLGDFFDKHKTIIEDFAKVALGLLILKLTTIGSIKAATSMINLANSIVSFPLKSVGAITEAFGNMKTQFGTLASSSGSIFSGLKTGLSSGATVLKNGLSGMASIAGQQITYIKGMFSKIMPTKLDFQLMLQSVKDAGGKVASAIGDWAGGVAGATKSAFSSMASGLSTLGSNALAAAKAFGASAWSGITSTLSTVGGAIASAATATWGWVTSAAAAVLSGTQAAIAWTADAISVGAAAVAEGAATAATWLLNAALAIDPIVLIVIAIAALVAGFVLLWNKCSWFRNFWKGLWADIKHLVDDAVGFVKSHLLLLTAIIATPLVPLVLLWQHWNTVWSDIKKWTSEAVDWVKSHLLLIVEVILGPLLGGILYLATHWTQVWDGIKHDAGVAWSWLDGNVFQPIGHFFSSVIMGALTGAKQLWDSVWGGFKSTVATVWAYLQPIFNAISGAISKVSGALSGISGAASKVGGWLSGAASAVGFEDGGFVPGAKGAPVMTIVHGGEYVVSNAMQSGSAPIDNRALSGVLAATSGGGGSSTSALAVGGGGGQTTVIQNFVTVQTGPQLSTDAAVQQAVQTAMNRLGMRNSTSYTPYSSSRARSS